MIRLLAICVFLVLGNFANAQSVKLTAAEITALLSGNTAIGKWDGIGYRQVFGNDGVTIYAQGAARPAQGKWRVDPERDEYQSIWPGEETWVGWYVMEYAGDFYWVSKATPPTLFRVEQGAHLVAQ
jgi:hypothetical protein